MKKLLLTLGLLSWGAQAASPYIWGADNMAENLARKGWYLATGEQYITLSVDPSAGAGVTAPVGSVGVRDDGGVGQFWVKTGAADTAWTDLTMGTPATIAIGNAITGASNCSVLFSDAGNLAQDASNFCWENTDKQLLLGDGTNALPAYSFLSDPSYGMSMGSSELHLNAGGSLILGISAGGAYLDGDLEVDSGVVKFDSVGDVALGSNVLTTPNISGTSIDLFSSDTGGGVAFGTEGGLVAEFDAALKTWLKGDLDVAVDVLVNDDLTVTDRVVVGGFVFIGAGTSGSSYLYMSKDIGGATTSRAAHVSAIVDNAVTTRAYGFNSVVGTEAAAFTLTNLTHFGAAQGTIGAASAVTEQEGFRCGTSLVGAASNFCFRSEIPAAAGRWGIYSDGTAQNHFRGNVGIGSGKTVPATALDVNGTVTATALDLTTVLPIADGGSGSGTIASGIVRSNGTALSGGGTVALGSEVTGVLPIANGGSAKALTAVAGGAVYTDADSMEVLAAGTAGQYLRSGGTSAPTWQQESSYSSISSDTTITATAKHMYITTSGSGTDLTLYDCTAVTGGFQVSVKRNDASNTQTILPDGADTIDGAASRVLATNLQAVTLVCDGAGPWFIF